MDRRQFVVALLFTMILLTLAFIPASNQQNGSYDPWLDYNGDGKVDASDLQALGQTYGGSGDSTKKVNVTNFPLDEHGNIRVKPRTVQKMVLMGTYLDTPEGLVPLLIDEDTPFVHSMKPNYYYLIPDFLELPISGCTVYDQRFEYNATSLTSYEIRGQAIAQIDFGFKIYFGSPTYPATAELNATLFLEKIDAEGGITVVCSGYDVWNYTATGFLTKEGELIHAFIFNFETPYIVNQNERLAMRLWVCGSSSDIGIRVMNYTHYLQSDFLFAIPIIIGLDT